MSPLYRFLSAYCLIPAAYCLLPAAYCLLSSGCTGMNRRPEPADPLMGGTAPLRGPAQPTSMPAAAAPAKPPTPPANATAQPLPAVSISPPTASLAGGQPPRYDADNSLRIPSPPLTPVSAWNNGSWQGGDNGVRLRSPETEMAPMRGPQIVNYEQAQSLLAQRGVKWQRWETTGDGDWKVACSIPNKRNQFISRTYEARGANYLSAVRAVLDQIEKDQQ